MTWYNTSVLNKMTPRWANSRGRGQQPAKEVLTMGILPSHKTCTKCGESKPLSKFHKQAGKPYGRRSHCKQCRRSQRARDKDELAARGLRRCNKCGEEKPFHEYNFDSRRGYPAPTCKSCWSIVCKQRYADNRIDHNRKNRERRLKNLEQYREKEARYWREHPEKARARNQRRRALKKSAPGDGISDTQWKDVLEHYGNKCLRCGSEGNLTMDHVIPLSKGGIHDPSNIQPLCGPCNSKKGTRKTDYRKKGAPGYWFQRKLFKE